MILGRALSEVLRGEGVHRIYVPKSILRKLPRDNVLQWISVHLLNGSVKLCRDSIHGRVIAEEVGVRILTGRGSERSDFVVLRRDKPCSNVVQIDLDRAALSPIFIIDLKFWDEHTRGEKNELVEQIVMSLRVIRSFLHDRCLVVTSVNDEFLELFQRAVRGMRHRMMFVRDDAGRFIRGNLKTMNIIPAVLDPESPLKLSVADVDSYNTFVIGGIVDKERVDKLGTYRLYMTLRLNELNVPRYSIRIDDSVIGVPDRINKIIEIVLLAKYVYRDLERAIVRAQAVRDKVMRIMYEIMRRSIKMRTQDGKMVYVIRRVLLDELARRYEADESVLKKVSSRLPMVVQS